MQLLILAAVGGAIGAGARHLVNVACAHCFGASFPWSTVIVNVLGSFLMGLVVAATVPMLGGSVALRTFLTTGILGGFTTFSAFSLDAWTLLEGGRMSALAIYVLGSVLLSITALVAGLLVIPAVMK